MTSNKGEKEIPLPDSQLKEKVSTNALIEALLSEAHETAEKIIQDVKKTVQGTLEEQRKKGRERAR